jgi:hypothetical protein
MLHQLSFTALLALLAGVSDARAEDPAHEDEGVEHIPPRLLSAPPLIYPAGQNLGAVELVALVRVDEHGHARDVHFAPGTPEAFIPAAREALEAATFAPGTFGGQPASDTTRVILRFEPPPHPDLDHGHHDDWDEEHEVIVLGERERAPQHGVGDIRVDVQEVLAVPVLQSADALKLAPGVMVARIGGDGEPEQIFLRGFDARHGQDIRFTVDGLPLNQVGNPHGHGLVDLHFLVPEALQTLHVKEGPFDPAQGDFTVAGSVDLELGLAEPGLLLGAQAGSFGARRGVVGWRHEEAPGTFAIAEVYTQEGFGENRGVDRASGLARWEGGEAVRASLLAGLYASNWQSAGAVRLDDVEAGRLDLYGTMDPRQGGLGQQAMVAGTLSGRADALSWELRAGFSDRAMEFRSNFTGALTDDRRPGEAPHDQRGDLLQQRFAGRTAHVDAEVRQEVIEEGAAHLTVAAGLAGRTDDTTATAWRLRAVDGVPYRIEQDYALRQAGVAIWSAAEVHAWERVHLHAGVRAESLHYALWNGCGAKDTWFPGAEQGDVNCPDEDRLGPRLRDQARDASGLAVAPRASVALDLGDGHSLQLAGGRGLRSMEALALSQGEAAPFGSLWGGEAGWQWRKSNDLWWGVQRAAAYATQVQRDLIFDEVQGANVLAGETTRYGATAESEVHLGGFTERTTLAYTYAVFGDELPPNYTFYNTDRQPGMRIPYVPPWLARADLSYAWEPRPGISLRPGLAANWIAPRPLPQSERSASVFTVDASVGVRRGALDVNLFATNLFNTVYPLAEFNYASWFPDVGGSPFPTRVAARHVSPGAPRAVYLGLTLHPDAAKDSP